MSTISSLRHIALVVPDLRAGEDYYRSVFGMGLIGREAELADGLWYIVGIHGSLSDRLANLPAWG